MQLNEIRDIGQLQVIRSAEFQSVGLLSHGLAKMLVCLYDPSFLSLLESNPAISCVITSPEFAQKVPDRLGLGVSEDPLLAFYTVHDHLWSRTNFYWEDFPSIIAPDAVIHETAFVARKNVRIGQRTVVEPHVTIHERSIVGDDVILRSGVVIGGEGFEPKHVGGKHIIVHHAGGVRIGHRVQIQCNSHVARSVFNGFCDIGDDTKLDAMVHVAHNVVIGRGCELAAGTVVSGTVTIGDQVWIGPNATISSEVRIGDRAYVALGSLVAKDVPDDTRVAGSPARALPQRKTAGE